MVEDMESVAHIILWEDNATGIKEKLEEHCVLKSDLTAMQERAEKAEARVKELENLPVIVCLCGSTRFMDTFFEEGWKETLAGKIVLSVGVCKHAADHGGEALGQDVADILDELHKRKIDLADEVYILNVDGYIGKSTRSELEYAKEHGKIIRYLEPLPQPPKG